MILYIYIYIHRLCVQSHIAIHVDYLMICLMILLRGYTGIEGQWLDANVYIRVLIIFVFDVMMH